MTKKCHESDLLHCPMPCTASNGRLSDIIARSVKSEYQSAACQRVDWIAASAFLKEGKRVFHFPPLELVGKCPRLAILGLSKGRTQVETALRYSFGDLPAAHLMTAELASQLLKTRGVHALFAGRQIRVNAARMLAVIGVWDALGIHYENKNPARSVDFLIGSPGDLPHRSIYIASVIKCGMLTDVGKSAAPSLKNIMQSYAATACISRNLFPAFDRYQQLKTAIVFGKCNYALMHAFKLEGKSLLCQFRDRDIGLIWLPHPSGANNVTVSQYCKNEKRAVEWCTNVSTARKMIATKFT